MRNNIWEITTTSPRGFVENQYVVHQVRTPPTSFISHTHRGWIKGHVFLVQLSYYFLLPSEQNHWILASSSYFHAPKVALRNWLCYHNINKKNWGMVWTPRLTKYMHTNETHQHCLDHLPYWLCNGMGNRKIDKKWLAKNTSVRKNLRWCCAFSRYADFKCDS